MTTLADVAKRANVSKMTVSRVINHPDQVTDELKVLVYKAMDELNYKPNRLAKALANQSTQMIKVLILEEMDSVEPYYMNLLMGIANELDQHAYGLQLLTKDGQDRGQADGYIICGMRESDFEQIDQLDDPVVLFGDNTHGYDFVDSDNQKNIEEVCDYAKECGYDNFVFIHMDVDEPFAVKRLAGYEKKMEEFGQDSQVFRFENDSEVVYDYMKDHIDDFPKNTAFICSTDRLALGLLQVLAFSRKSVPEDYGVTGHDGVFIDQLAHPKLTTIQQDIRGMGRACAKMILNRIKNKNLAQQHLYYPSNLSVGKTTK